MTLGQILLGKGLISEEQLDEAVRRQQLKGDQRLGETLVALGYLGEHELAQALAEQTGLDWVELAEFKPDPVLMGVVPAKLIFRYEVVPIGLEDNQLTVASPDPFKLRAFDEIRALSGYKVRPVMACESEIKAIINNYFGIGADTVDRMRQDAGEVQVIEDSAGENGDLAELAEDATLIRLVNQILKEALSLRASDVHIEPYERKLVIRYRIDGVLQEAPIPARFKQFQSAIISRIKIMADLNIAEKRLPQDGRIRLLVSGRQIDVRVSIVPTLYGEGVVLRILDQATMFLSLEEIGMEKDTLVEFTDIISEPHGIFLVTGPTGCGKTTTLYAALEKVRSPEKKVITIEDPVEYQLDGVNQIQVRPAINLTFANGLRNIIRHDPDVIMVGEIRDKESADIAVHAALTGHLVFSTLHTNDTAGAITRLLDMGVEPYLVASSVEGVMAQRLVRLICPHCREEDPHADLGLLAKMLGHGNAKAFRGRGCPRCRNVGYLGRQGIFELLRVDEAVKEMILQRTSTGHIKGYAVERGMRTLRQEGWLKVARGITSMDEVYRLTKDDRLSDGFYADFNSQKRAAAGDQDGR